MDILLLSKTIIINRKLYITSGCKQQSLFKVKSFKKQIQSKKYVRDLTPVAAWLKVFVSLTQFIRVTITKSFENVIDAQSLVELI